MSKLIDFLGVFLIFIKMITASTEVDVPVTEKLPQAETVGENVFVFPAYAIISLIGGSLLVILMIVSFEDDEETEKTEESLEQQPKVEEKPSETVMEMPPVQ